MRDRHRPVQPSDDVEQLPGHRHRVGNQRPLFLGGSPVEGHPFTSSSACIRNINVRIADQQI
jgi:hypothetical protein